MAIIRTKEEHVDKLASKTVERNVAKNNSSLEEWHYAKKKGFLKSVFIELGKVNWPTWKHTASWSAVVVGFTVVLTLFIGVFDHGFKNISEYTACTASVYRGTGTKDFNQCNRELGANLTKLK